MIKLDAVHTMIAAAVLAAPGTALASYGAGHGSVAAFYTPDDGYDHAIIAQSNGNVREVFFADNSFSSGSVLTSFSGIVGLGAYYTPADHNRHVIVGLSNGQVWEVYYNPSFGVRQDQLFTIPAGTGTISAVAGFVSSSGQQNAVVATTEGMIFDYQWPSWQLHTVVGLASTDDINGMTAFATSDGVDHIVFSRTDSPVLLEAYWYQGGVPSEFSTPLRTLEADLGGDFGTSIVSLGGFANPSGYSGADDILFTNTSNQLRDYAYTGSGNDVTGHTTTDWPFTYGPSIVASGAFTAGSSRHSVVAMSNGDLWDMYQPAPGSGWTYYKLGDF
jgi:hypothetical protein